MSNSKSKQQVSSPKNSNPTGWRSIQQRNHERHLVANAITVLMIVLTILVLVWIAYQLNNPVALNLSRLLHR
jgi:hypothetical protein